MKSLFFDTHIQLSRMNNKSTYILESLVQNSGAAGNFPAHNAFYYTENLFKIFWFLWGGVCITLMEVSGGNRAIQGSLKRSLGRSRGSWRCFMRSLGCFMVSQQASRGYVVVLRTFQGVSYGTWRRLRRSLKRFKEFQRYSRGSQGLFRGFKGPFRRYLEISGAFQIVVGGTGGLRGISGYLRMFQAVSPGFRGFQGVTGTLQGISGMFQGVPRGFRRVSACLWGASYFSNAPDIFVIP